MPAIPLAQLMVFAQTPVLDSAGDDILHPKYSYSSNDSSIQIPLDSGFHSDFGCVPLPCVLDAGDIVRRCPRRILVLMGAVDEGRGVSFGVAVAVDAVGAVGVDGNRGYRAQDYLAYS